MKASGHHIKLLAAATVLVFIWLVYRLTAGSDSRIIPLPKWRKPAASHAQSFIQILEGDEAREYCGRHRLAPFPADLVHSRKIYDLVMVNSELDMLEVRLGQLYPFIDFFVVLESDRTLSDKAKPLHVLENWSRFAPFHDKMIRRTLDLESLTFDGSAFDREHQSRNAMLTQVFPSLDANQSATTGDILIVSDPDEIPKPDVLATLRNCAVPDKMTIHSDSYYYGFQWRSREAWPHPQATLYRGNETWLPHDLRRASASSEVDFRHGAWHCSFCFGSMAEMVWRAGTFAREELNKPEFSNPELILRRVRLGFDFFDRKENVIDFVAHNEDVPGFVKQNADRFKFMLDRSPPNGNFWDVPANGSLIDVLSPAAEAETDHDTETTGMASRI